MGRSYLDNRSREPRAPTRLLRRVVAGLIASTILAACTKTDSVPLVGGYQVTAMNSRELYVAAPNNQLVVGYAIANVGTSGDFIVVECAAVEGTANGFANMTGLTIVDTATGAIYRVPSEARREMSARGVDLDAIEMKPMSDYF